MRSLLFTIATLVACSSRVSAAPATSVVAPPPVGTFGHTVALANNTIFIQGGSTSRSLSNSSYAIILGKDGSLNDATWQDTSKLSALTSRNYGVAAATDNVMITCGTDDGAKAAISCDQFDVIWYNKTTVEPAGIPNRAGMAVAYSAKNNKAYFVGGYGNNNEPVGTVTIATLPAANNSPLQLEKGTDVTAFPRKFHSATWVDGMNGIVMLGGQATAAGVVQPFNPAVVFDASTSTWTTVALTIVGSEGTGTRSGHSAVHDGNGSIYVYGGIDSNGNVQNDLLVLDTKQPRANWALQFLSKGPDPRVYHTATLLPDNTMLIMWGQNGKGAASAQPTYMLFDIGRNFWITAKPQAFPAIVVTTESPNTPKPVPNDPPVVKPNPNGPNDPPQSNNPDKGISGSGSGGNVNVPLIAGLCAAGVVLLFLIIILILLIRRRNRRNRPIPTYHPTMMGKGDMAMAPPYEEEDKAKQATAFMIRRPPSVYMVDDQGADYDVNPNSKSQYYGERDPGRESSVAEYELNGAGRNTLSTVDSVAERRRYVEEQQRQFREGYENAYHHPPPFASNSRDDRDYDDDDEPSSARRTNSSTGPRYPRAETSRRGQASTYEHPANDYFA